MLESFRLRSFRFQWASDAFATWASEMETLLLGWYVLVDTGSPFLVGLVGALRFGGTLLGPFYGVVADRMDRRTLLMALRLAQAAQAATLAALALSGQLQPWHAFAISAAGGLVRMGENVVRQSLIADVVPSAALLNAVSLSRTTMDLAKIAGSLAGAGLLSRLGMGPAFAAVTACYLASTALVLGIARQVLVERKVESAFANLRGGLAYMRHSPTIVAIMFLAFLVNLTVFPLTNGLMPVVARDVFAGGPGFLALLLSATAAGAVAGSLGLAALSRLRSPERTMVASIAAWHVLLLVFARLDGLAGAGTVPGAVSLGVPLAVLAAYGAVTSGSMVTMSTVLLRTADVEFRGRVMGVRMMAVYGLPMGLLLGGYLGEALGIMPALTLLGLAGLALTAWAALRWPALVRGTPAVSPQVMPAVVR
jgi:MFS family permease